MAEYIDREALKERVASYAGMFANELGFVVRLQAVLNGIEFAPAADVVEVVRCKGCKYYKPNPYGEDDEKMCQCWADWLPTQGDDFCSYGERKNEKDMCCMR